MVGSHDTQAPALGQLPSSRLGTCGKAMARPSSLPPFKRPANGGIGRREPPWARLRRGHREGRAVPSPRPPPAQRTHGPAHKHARAVLRNRPLFLSTVRVLSHLLCGVLLLLVNPGLGSEPEEGCVESGPGSAVHILYSNTETTQATLYLYIYFFT